MFALRRLTQGLKRFSTATSSEALDMQRRRILYRARKRGTLESDLVIGTFANQYLPTMSKTELDEFEVLLKEDDPFLYKWIMGQEAPPEEFDNSVLKRLQKHSKKGSFPEYGW
jgi:succinate dehydrogenase assembly factor 2